MEPFLTWTLQNEIPVPADVLPLLVEGQQAVASFKTFRDSATFTSKRLIVGLLHDDLLEQGESICPNRVSRLAQLAGIKAQIGYKRRSGSYDGKAAKKRGAIQCHCCPCHL